MMTASVGVAGFTDDDAWAAVLRRDRAADGGFVYAVSSTGVYCRPSCSSKRPRRENAAFFRSPAEAERGGYRACLKCDPRGDRGREVPAPVLRARDYLDLHVDERVPLARLGREAGMSPHHLQRTFKRAFGVSPREYQDARRLARFKRSLKEGGRVTDAILDAGYGSPSRVYEKSDARLGMPPGTYRRGGQGMAIGYATADTAVGRVLVAATERGVCAVTLGDDHAALVAGLRAEFPGARVAEGGEAAARWLAAVVASLADGADLGEVPVDLRGTAFQQRVWRALREIPRGATSSYAEIARAIGRPGAARAVAGACAANRVALVVPCHRVVRGGGEPGGYRWGAARKRALLAGEARKR
jgi:AraC family transcriptional regulator of adaptative response/methylated-DNA-[protein]-cysteine methyltransferase